MNIFEIVTPFERPSNVLAFLDGSGSRVTEMIDSERGFLCGLIREFRPKKIVEVGVAEGGTSAVILNCIHQLSLNCTLYSIDLSERLYCDQSKETAWQLKQAAQAKPAEIDLTKHKLLLGNVLPAWLDDIAGKIDFLILDTTHRMPGEVLDFIAAFPYLSEDAIVVLHDVNYGYGWKDPRGIATTVLFQSVVANKFLNNQEDYPNIAAFQLNCDTPQYMCNMFIALMTVWSYLPEEEHLKAYEDIITKNYPAEYLRIYRQAVREAQHFFANQIAYSNQEVFKDSRSKARQIADRILPKGTRRRNLAKKILPKGSRRWNFCKKIYKSMFKR